MISNMYPSVKDPTYGTFVKIMTEGVSKRNKNGTTRLIAIRGRRKDMCRKILAYAQFYLSTLYCLLFHRYDLIYVHTITFPVIPLRIALLFKKLPLVFNVHGGDVIVNSRLKGWLKRLARPILSKAKLVVVPSGYFKGVVIDHFPEILEGNIFVSPSGGVSRYFFKKSEDCSSCRDGDWNSLTIGYVSRIDFGKGWDTYLEAISRLRKAGFECRGIMAGVGAQVDRMLSLRHGLALDDVVEYCGAIPQERLWEDFYQHIDIFVFPTMRKAESLGLVGLEAMASRRYLFASDIGGPAEYIVDGVNGFLFSTGDSESLKDKIIQFMKMPPHQRGSMLESAAETAARYETELVNDELYAKLIQIV